MSWREEIYQPTQNEANTGEKVIKLHKINNLVTFGLYATNHNVIS